MIDIRKLKELVRLMVSNDLTELDLRDSQEQVVLRRSSPGGVPTLVSPMAQGAVAMAPVGGGAATATLDEETDSESGLVAIESPMVGTFYASPAPEKPPFVSVGTSLGPDSVVCLIEAMKVFNEIKAETSGTIERVLVRNGEPVEFGQKLFLVRPS